MDEDLASAIADATLAADGLSVFACARMAARRQGDPDRYATVPCLARMEESVLLALVARGVQDVVLVDGNCATCKHRGCVPGIEATVESANALLAAQGSEVRVRRASAFPEEVLVQDARTSRTPPPAADSSPRQEARPSSAAKTAAEKTVAKALNDVGQKKPTLRECLRMSEGALPQFNPERRMRVLDSLDALGQSVVPALDTRLFGSRATWTLEAVLVVRHVRGVLPHGRAREAATWCRRRRATGSLLEFSAADCVQCNLCADACLKECLTVSPASWWPPRSCSTSSRG